MKEGSDHGGHGYCCKALAIGRAEQGWKGAQRALGCMTNQDGNQGVLEQGVDGATSERCGCRVGRDRWSSQPSMCAVELEASVHVVRVEVAREQWCS